jgi:uncharacterized protein (TIRG00374 family)
VVTSAKVEPEVACRSTPNRRGWVWPLSLALAVGFLYLALRGVDWRQVWTTIAGCHLGLFSLSLLCGCVAYFLRGFRWRILLTAQEPIGVWTVFWANSAGYFGSNVLPARAGELVRTAMISSRSRMTTAYVLTTALTERIMDLIVLVLAGSSMVAVMSRKPAWLAAASKAAMTIGLGGALVLLLFPVLEPVITRCIDRLLVSSRTRNWLVHVLGQVSMAIRTFHDTSRFFQFLLVTLMIWSIDAGGATILARALGLHLSLPVALLLLTGLGLGSALPSTPGYVGVYQFVFVTILMPFNFSRADAIAFSLVGQVSGFVILAVLGLIGIWQYRKVWRLSEILRH